MSDTPHRQASDAPSTYGIFLVLALMLAQMVSFIDRMIMGLLVMPIRQSFDISDTQYSLLAGFAFALFYAIMGLPLGRLADRVNRTKLIAFAIAFWSVMTALCGFAKGFWSLFLARMGVGIGEAALGPSAYSLISDTFSKNTLARALSIYSLGTTIGSGLAYLIGGWVVARTMQAEEIVLPIIGARESWQLTFFIVGIPGLIVALIFFLLPEPPRKGLIKSGASITFRETFAFMAQRWQALFLHIIAMSLFILVVYSVNIWGPEYLIRTFNFSRPAAGQTFGIVMMVAGTAGLLMGGTLGDYFFAKNGQRDGYSRAILISMAGMFPCMAALYFANTPTLGILAIGLAVFFSAWQGGLGGGLIQLMLPNQMRGQGVALYFLCANLIGIGIGPVVAAAFNDYVFKSDAALNKSIALCGVIIIPIAALILTSSLSAVRRTVLEARAWEQA